MSQRSTYWLFLAVNLLIGVSTETSVPEHVEDDEYHMEDFVEGSDHKNIFYLAPGYEFCFFEDVDGGSEFSFDVETADGLEDPVRVKITPPKSETKIFQLKDFVYETYNITESGPLTFCFYAPSYRKIWMFYSMIGKMPTNTTNHDLMRLNELLKEVHRYLTGNSLQINTLIHQSAIHVYLLTQKHRYVFYLSVILCISIAVLSFGQVYMVKKLFHHN
ncbi:hypothetical protein RF11_14680 [Thelohanellus kitauei]|uniref:GOLD domain-containing protein n=1 Tax=Thelohanellus kitauei TaxID=669202 RepID=A0A0C2IZW4_THEKT|nr:hypothetical protein RF11_14680 [Thelohanellus kitauei]